LSDKIKLNYLQEPSVEF